VPDRKAKRAGAPRRTTRRTAALDDQKLVEQFSARMDETIGLLVWDTARVYQSVWIPMLARVGIGFGLYHFLRILNEHDGFTFRQLSDAAHLRGPTTVKAIRELERRGLVRRSPNPSDARKINIFLTDKGRRLVKKVLPVSAVINQQGVIGISRHEQDELKRLLRQLRDNMLRKRASLVGEPSAE
jgi:DNA-binding MarR family transcriptional regulator